VGRVDLFGEKVGLGKDNCGDSWVICLICYTAEIGCLDDWAVLFEETLVVAEVVWVDFEEISNIGETLRAWCITDSVSIYGDGDGSVGRSDLSDLV
jgi:hypothetical protein